MINSLVLKIATAFLFITVSSHAVEVFSVLTQGKSFPTTRAVDYNAVDENGAPTNRYNFRFYENGAYVNSYHTNANVPDAGNGSAWGNGVTQNFKGLDSAINPGDQRTSGNTTTTYFGPTVYAGVNRDTYDTGAGVIHSDGNGYRIRTNAITAAEIGTPEIGTAQVGIAQVGTAQVGTAQVGTAQVGTAQVGTAQVGTAQVGTAQVGTAQVGTAQVGTAQVGTAQVGTAQVGTAQVGTAPVAQVGVEGEPGYVAPQPASDDYVAASSDYAPASDDYVAASSDYAPASDDYAPASDDYVAASSDYVAASSDYAAAIPASDPVTITISGNAVATANMNSTGDAVESVTLSGDLSGYTALPTVVFTGGGMTEAPTVSFNFSTGNLNTGVIKQLNLGYDAVTGTTNWGLLNDGQTMTYIQSYDSSDDSLSYYYSLTNNATGVTTGPIFITTLTAAEHSGGGFGFFDVITGNKWGKPNSQDAVTVSYKRYTNADAAVSTVHIDSISVATTDDDRDGVINRNDAFQNNPYESVDTDLDGVGDNSDQHPGYNDSVISAGITQAVWDASQTALTTAQTAKATAEAAQATAETDLSVAQTALSTAQTDLSTAQTDLATAQTDLATAQTAQATAEAALAAAPTLADVQQTVMDARPGSTRIDVVGGKANITLTLEETSAVSDWSSASTSEQTFEVDAPAGTSFYRFKVGEDDE